jgi:hypothetical protein
VEITSGGSGSGPGTAGYSVEPSFTYGCRSGRLTIAGQDFTVNETGQVADSDCDGIPDSVEPSEGRNSNLKDNDVFAIARLFVMRVYQNVLEREPDAGGLAFWRDPSTGRTRIRW